MVNPSKYSMAALAMVVSSGPSLVAAEEKVRGLC